MDVPVTVNVAPVAPTLDILGGTFSWSSTNATTCTASGDWGGVQSANGTQSFSIPGAGSYKLTCTGPGGTVNRTLTLTDDLSPLVSSKFAVGNQVTTIAYVNVRSSASLSGTILGTQPTGAIGTIIGSPIYSNGYWWWNVSYNTGAVGWSVENWLL